MEFGQGSGNPLGSFFPCLFGDWDIVTDDMADISASVIFLLQLLLKNSVLQLSCCSLVHYKTLYIHLCLILNSQHIILPPYQRQGLGSILLESVMSNLRTLDHVIDITVESPNSAFTAIRDRIDCKECLRLPDVKAFDFDKNGPENFIPLVRVCCSNQKSLPPQRRI